VIVNVVEQVMTGKDIDQLTDSDDVPPSYAEASNYTHCMYVHSSRA